MSAATNDIKVPLDNPAGSPRRVTRKRARVGPVGSSRWACRCHAGGWRPGRVRGVAADTAGGRGVADDGAGDGLCPSLSDPALMVDYFVF